MPIHLSATHVARVLHLAMTTMPAHVKANPVEVSLLSFEAIVFVTKYLAHLFQQALGLGKIDDGVHGIKTMYEITVFMSVNKLSSGLQLIHRDVVVMDLQLIPADKLVSQNIRRSRLRWASAC